MSKKELTPKELLRLHRFHRLRAEWPKQSAAWCRQQAKIWADMAMARLRARLRAQTA